MSREVCDNKLDTYDKPQAKIAVKEKEHYVESAVCIGSSISGRLISILPPHMIFGRVLIHLGGKDYKNFAAAIGLIGETRHDHRHFVRKWWRIYLA